MYQSVNITVGELYILVYTYIYIYTHSHTINYSPHIQVSGLICTDWIHICLFAVAQLGSKQLGRKM
jgi:hypothetical protein